MKQTTDKTAGATTGLRSFVGIRNTAHDYGSLAIFLHWLVALAVVGMFTLGVWMTGLTYYDVWYKRAPDIHKSIGILLLLIMFARVIWRIFSITPEYEPGMGMLQRRIAHGVHLLLYILLFAMMMSGYLISTADGKPIEVFDLFSVPAIHHGIPNMEDIAGEVHWYLALILLSVAGLHSAAALKHHFIDRDRTLVKILGIRSDKQKPQKLDLQENIQ